MSTTYKQKERSLEECLALIENGDIIAVSGVTTEPANGYSAAHGCDGHQEQG